MDEPIYDKEKERKRKENDYEMVFRKQDPYRIKIKPSILLPLLRKISHNYNRIEIERRLGIDKNEMDDHIAYFNRIFEIHNMKRCDDYNEGDCWCCGNKGTLLDIIGFTIDEDSIYVINLCKECIIKIQNYCYFLFIINLSISNDFIIF